MSFFRRARRASAFTAIGSLLFVLSAACAGAEPSATIEPAELISRIAEGKAPFVLDVRSEKEFAAGHIPGAINIPHDALADRLSELPDDKASEIVVHCQSGRRAGMAEEVLKKNGYTGARDLVGHWKAWSKAGHPTESPR